MFGWFELSETAKAVLWLWNNDDAKNWRVGAHAVVHEPTGVGIWTANECYGISIYYNIPVRDRGNAHACSGRQVRLNWRERRALYRAVRVVTPFVDREIQRQVSDWASAKIRNDTESYSYERA